MKTLIRASAFSLLLAVILTSHVSAQTQTLPAADQKDIKGLFDTIEHGIQIGGVDGEHEVTDLLSSNAREGLDSDIFYGMPFSGDTKSVSLVPTGVKQVSDNGNTVTYNSTLSATIDGNHGIETFNSQPFFTFKKESDGLWYLYDTDFYKGLGSSFSDEFSDASTTSAASGTDTATDTGSMGTASSLGFLALFLGLGGIFIIIPLVLGLLLSIFWIWMLIEECIRPDYHNKPFWILLTVFTGAIGAAFYYFMQHRPYKKGLKAVGGTASAPATPSAPVVEPSAPTPPPATPPQA